jgi:hypothetical protein
MESWPVVEAAIVIPYRRDKPGLSRRAVELVSRACKQGRFRIGVTDDAPPNWSSSGIANLAGLVHEGVSV